MRRTLLRALLPTFLIATLSLLTSTAAHATTLAGSRDNTGPPDPTFRYWHLRYADLVIECTVESTRHRAVADAELLGHGDGTRKLRIDIAQLSHVVVLKGSQLPQEVYVGLPVVDAVVSHRVILCCYWIPGLHMYGSVYPQHAYVKRGDEWVQLEDALNAPEISISATDLKVLIAGTQPAHLAADADLVAVGRLESVSDSSIAFGDSPLRVQKVLLVPDTVFKGESTSPIEFCIARGAPFPRWNTKTPYQFEVGETWFVFLKRHEEGFYYPAAGVNGLLLVHGQELLFDRKVHYPYSRLSLTRLVKASLDER